MIRWLTICFRFGRVSSAATVFALCAFACILLRFGIVVCMCARLYWHFPCSYSSIGVLLVYLAGRTMVWSYVFSFLWVYVWLIGWNYRFGWFSASDCLISSVWMPFMCPFILCVAAHRVCAKSEAIDNNILTYAIITINVSTLPSPPPPLPSPPVRRTRHRQQHWCTCSIYKYTSRHTHNHVLYQNNAKKPI